MGDREIIDDAIEKEFQLQIEFFDYSKQTIIELGEAVEILFAQRKPMLGNSFLPVLELIIERLMNKEFIIDNKNNELLSYYKLLEVAGDYHTLRDYIYYSYADERSIKWEHKENTIQIRVLDKSIFRQLVHNMQTLFLNSSKLSGNNIMPMDEIILSLKDKDEFDFNNDEIAKVLDSIEQEVKIKLKSYFSYITSDSKVSFGKYVYSDFINVYTELLKISLYRRYYSYANNLPSVIIFGCKELSEAISKTLELEEDKSLCILMDISHSSRGTLNYIKEDNVFIMYLTCFSLFDGITNILKYYAVTNPNGFLANFSGPIGESLVNDIEKTFLKFENFRCIKDKKLNKYSQRLPDIDLLAISYEPSLGFHIFACEIKNALIPLWAKDYIKSSGKKGYITKALSQIEHINEFVNTEEGYNMLYEIVLENFSFMNLKKVFPRGFCILIDYVIVTSENIGVLCDDSNKSIVSASMLKEIIDNSDGDVNYIKDCLNELNKAMDSCLNIESRKTVINGIDVNYEVCNSDILLKFSKNYYISDGTYKELENTALETGYSFIDGLNNIKN